jgi:serine/threonine-protein kinase
VSTNEKPQLPGLKILHKIGEGGMASVWKAIDLKNHLETVAVKVLNVEFSANSDDVENFNHEADALKSFSHPNIVKCRRIEKFERTWFYVMEFVDGYNFGTLLERKQSLPEMDCLLIAESLSHALNHAWNDHGIVHCDIKPENIMINTNGEIKLTDLGLCHTYDYIKEGEVDIPDHIMGTPAYISPEQIYGDVVLDCRADIYSLAATLYHLSTGRVLFPGYDTDEMLKAHCDNTMSGRDPRVYKPGLSEGLCQLLEAMLVKDRDYRVSSWSDVYKMCQMVENGKVFKPRTDPAASSVLLER